MSTYSVVTPINPKRSPQRMGTTLLWMGFLTGTTSYATGGDTLDFKSLGFGNAIEGGLVSQFATHVSRVIPQVGGTAKILHFVTSTGVEVGNTVNMSTEAPFAILFGH